MAMSPSKDSSSHVQTDLEIQIVTTTTMLILAGVFV